VWLDAVYLINRHFWLDELFTFRIVADPDLMHSLRAVQSGTDANPPVLLFLLRTLSYFTGGASEQTFRFFSLASVMAALVGLYVGLRQDFGVLASAAAVLAIWAHPLVLDKAFDGRFYGPWLALVVWFAYLFRQALRGRANAVTYTLLGATAVLLCTIHYFGVVTLGLVACTGWILMRPAWAVARRAFYVSALGPLALLICIPVFLIGQRRALMAPTWIKLAAPGDLLNFIRSVLLPYHLGAVLVTAAASAALSASFVKANSSDVPESSPSVWWGIIGVLLLVPFLIVFSYAVQPATTERYAFPAVAALAPVTAFAVSRMRWFWAVALCGFLLLVSSSQMRTEARRYADIDQDTDTLIEVLRSETASNDVPIIFESNHEAFVLGRYAPDLAARSFYLDYEPDQLAVHKAIRLHDRDMARIHARIYGQPRLMKWEVVQTLPRVLLVKGSVYDNRVSHAPLIEHEISGRLSELVNQRYAATEVEKFFKSAARSKNGDKPAS
jgi:hypothetical protein